MKTKFFFIILLTAFGFTGASAQGKTTKTNIKVFGNCGMCKNRIETALELPGIKVATWDTETKNLEVVYNNRKLTEEQIHNLVASTGHDTDKVKAEDEVYAKLPFCCLYRDHDHSNVIDEPHQGEHHKDH